MLGFTGKWTGFIIFNSGDICAAYECWEPQCGQVAPDVNCHSEETMTTCRQLAQPNFIDISIS